MDQSNVDRVRTQLWTLIRAYQAAGGCVLNENMAAKFDLAVGYYYKPPPGSVCLIGVTGATSTATGDIEDAEMDESAAILDIRLGQVRCLEYGFEGWAVRLADEGYLGMGPTELQRDPFYLLGKEIARTLEEEEEEEVTKRQVRDP